MSERDFRQGIRSGVRGLWNGAISASQFEETLQSTIRRNLSKAWLEGAKECGISQDDLTEQEIEARDAFISEQFEYIGGFAEAIEENSKENEGRLGSLYSRAEMWVNRYGEIKNQAKAMACKDAKLEWKTNVRCKEHCYSCTRLNGKVKRASYWNRTILPRSRNLECGGFRCCCDLMPTDKPVSRGRLSF